MNILQINKADIEGGAERVARDLTEGLLAEGHAAWMAIDLRKGTDDFVLQIPRLPPGGGWGRACRKLQAAFNQSKLPGAWRLAEGFRRAAPGLTGIRQRRGEEVFDFPGSRKLEQLPPARPDIVHAHNLHGAYFDLRELQRLSRTLPVVLTLHDEWMLTGHCSYSLGCERWRNGCGHCPDLAIPPAIEADGTAGNWKRKQGIYAHSRLHVATPSRWLHDRVSESMLQRAELKVINNGVDLSVFHPGDRAAARAGLDIAPDELVLMYAANFRNPFKDFPVVEKALAGFDQPAVMICLGGDERREQREGDRRILHIPYVSEPADAAALYRAADLFLYATRADNFPLVILEAMACGAAVAATEVGGIAEQVIPLEPGGGNRGEATGLLVAQGDADGLGDALRQCAGDRVLLRELGGNGARTAAAFYGRDRMVSDYLDWYRTILEA